MLRKGLETSIEYIHFTGHPKKRLPGHVSFWIEFVEGESLLLWLNLNGVASSSGSACSSNMMALDETGLKSSHVLTAIGVPAEICNGSITFSLGRESAREDVEHVLGIMPALLRNCGICRRFMKSSRKLRREINNVRTLQ